jgi:hypothetical protein
LRPATEILAASGTKIQGVLIWIIQIQPLAEAAVLKAVDWSA